MQARLAAAAMVLVLAFPAAGRAGDNPWTTIKQLFHEPVSELKQQLKQLRSPPKATTAAKPKANVTDLNGPEAADATAPVPIPVARPAREVASGGAAESTAVLAPSTPLQGNSPILIDPASATTHFVKPDEDTSGSVANDAGAPAAGFVTTGSDVPVTGSVAAKADVAESDSAATVNEDGEFAGAPIPRPRPENVIAYAAVGAAPPASKSAAAIGALVAPSPSIARPPPAARSTCGVALAKLGVEAKPIAPISEGVCGVPEPVAVAALGGGDINLTTKAIVDCELAETFANWLEDDVQRAAQKLLRGEVVGLRVAASYACRSRNNVAGAKLSEHAHGNAIDISAFNVAGHGWIEVGGLHGLAETRFLATVRRSACGPFKTVLGPGSDSYHGNHFHLDLAQRNNRGPSRGLYCH